MTNPSSLITTYDGSPQHRILLGFSTHAFERFNERSGRDEAELLDQIAHGTLFGRPMGIAQGVKLPCGLIAVISINKRDRRRFTVATVLTREQFIEMQKDSVDRKRAMKKELSVLRHDARARENRRRKMKGGEGGDNDEDD